MEHSIPIAENIYVGVLRSALRDHPNYLNSPGLVPLVVSTKTVLKVDLGTTMSTSCHRIHGFMCKIDSSYIYIYIDR